MGSDYLEQAKNYAPEIRDMTEANLFHDDDDPSQRIILAHQAKVWRKTNDIQSLFRASEGIVTSD